MNDLLYKLIDRFLPRERPWPDAKPVQGLGIAGRIGRLFRRPQQAAPEYLD